MARATAAEVQKIIQVSASVSDLTPFITAASSLVGEVCADAGYDEERLTLIENWLAAHFYAIRDPRLSSEGAGGASGVYQGQTAMVLAATTYGQQVMLLDTAGAFAALSASATQGKRRRVGITWLGTPPDELDTGDE